MRQKHWKENEAFRVIPDQFPGDIYRDQRLFCYVDCIFQVPHKTSAFQHFFVQIFFMYRWLADAAQRFVLSIFFKLLL